LPSARPDDESVQTGFSWRISENNQSGFSQKLLGFISYPSPLGRAWVGLKEKSPLYQEAFGFGWVVNPLALTALFTCCAGVLGFLNTEANVLSQVL
jgi:hypothetical protein